MKKLIRLAGLILVAVVSYGLTACGSDDNDDEGRNISYTEAEILEIITGTWEVYGEAIYDYKRFSFSKNHAKYKGRLEFMSNQKIKYNMIEGGEIEYSNNTDTYTSYIDEAIFKETKYKILKKNGKNYISFYSAEKGETKQYPAYDFEIRKLEKNSLMMVCDQDFTRENEKGDTEIIGHLYMTIISN